MKNGWIGKITDSEQDTINLGVELSKYIENGDIIALHGDLGSGKTTLTKGIMQGLEYAYAVTSPTYTLLNEYSSRKDVIHIDCYKESDLGIWISLGLNDYINNKENIIVIEWPELLISILPDDVINIRLNHISKNKREIFFHESNINTVCR